MEKEHGLQVFENENFGNVRVVMRDGDPWFVAADVCKSLCLGQVTNSTRRLDDDEKALISIKGISRGNDEATVVNESGLYSLVLSSRKPEAKAFKRWITHDVIPALRKTGTYTITTKQDSYMIEDPIARAERWIEERKERDFLQAQIEEQRPAVEFTESICKSSDNIKMRDMAKLLCDENINIGEKRLYNLLRDKKVLMQDKSRYYSIWYNWN